MTPAALKRILVVDDEAMICELIAETLRDSGYSVDTAPNGADALESMRRRLPHAIVLDLMMPRSTPAGFVARMRLEPTSAPRSPSSSSPPPTADATRRPSGSARAAA